MMFTTISNVVQILQPSLTMCSVPGSRPPARKHDPSRFWAVLIGIDAYPGHPLYGCVSDARAMKNYLIKDLDVPNDHIRCLLRPHALNDKNPPVNDPTILVPTRENIINTLLKISTDDRISFGDSIIIYFSGHGASYGCQTHNADHNQNCTTCGIDALCPSDRNTRDPKDPMNNTIIPDISDRELNVIFAQICAAKGRKITVILDCCFSGSLTRAPQPILQGVRSLPPSQLQRDALHAALRIADTEFKALSLPWYQSILPDARWQPNMGTHVVLAACSEYEFAKEVKGPNGATNGVFTQALLRALTSELRGGETYKSLLSLLEASHEGLQTPVVAGTYQNKPLWH
ncbi:peptidase C14, caspase domain-containing protein [Armillaria mellea]|nr:peptidase C14, caspase domain-containing protein [Armillaria mellea]